jgi:iron complex outermembrane receptor protein
MVVAAAVTAISVRAQSGSQHADSLRHYELSEIVIGGTATRIAEAAPVRRVHLAEIVRLAAPDVASVARLVPSVHAQTNSRGETLVYIRAAGERQVATFLDGALLNVPWDNRVDLGLVPASVLGGVGVVGGAGSVLYGTNTLGGAVLLSSRSLEHTGSVTDISTLAGTQGTRRIDAMRLVRRGPRSLLAAAGWSRTDGVRVPGGAELPYGGSVDGIRLNSDRRLAHVYVRGDLEGSGGRAGLSVLHVDSEQGVAPEGHLDPDIEPVRYWRYPIWRMTMLTLNGRLGLGSFGSGRVTAWASRFRQRIDQYASDDYAALTDRQDDEDLTFGTRMIVERQLRRGYVRMAVNALTSTHDQVDLAAGPGEALGVATDERYRQHVWSVAAEYGGDLSDRTRAVAGVSLDGIATPLTGDKPDRDAQVDWAAAAGAAVDLSPGWHLRLAAGRKVRFPTPRELFGTALNRFLVNENLKPETAWSSEVALVRAHENGHVEAVAFVRRTFDTIDQENVTVDGERLRRRINLDGSSVVGLEITGEMEPKDGLEIEGVLTVMRIRPTGDAERSRLVEKPDVLGTVTATWTTRWGGAATLQAVYTGRSWGLDPDNALVPLPRVTQVNARLAWRHYLSGRGIFTEVFVRGDNLFDVVVLPQLGLPGPGRSGRLGVSLSI